MQRQGENWLAEFNSAIAKGRLTKTLNGKTKVALDFVDFSALPSLKTDHADLPGFKNLTGLNQPLPLIDITSDKVLWRGVNLGKFELNSERDGNGVKFKQISLSTGKEQKFNFTGDWQQPNGKPVTRIKGQASIEKFGDLLAKLNFTEQLKETSATINAQLNWQGAPYQAGLANLNGNIELNLHEGRLSSIEPGFGRVLGVLAMAQWIKRLQLNFSDIYKEGLSFNHINGHFELSNGKATTHDLLVDAIPAKITLQGELNLVTQTLNQQISVIPKSSDAVPIAGTIVGSIATAIAQTVTGEYEDGYYLRSKYQVTGKWDNLEVKPLHDQDGLLKKTWQVLTDFPWITQPKQD
jgi:uncharacterized protein YhdP